MDLITTLGKQIDKALKTGGSAVQGTSINSKIQYMVWQALNGTLPEYPPQTLQAVIRAAIVARITASTKLTANTSAVQELTITSLTPTRGRLQNGTTVPVVAQYQVHLGDRLNYQYRNGKYYVTGVQPGFTKMSTGWEARPKGVFVRLGQTIASFSETKVLTNNLFTTEFIPVSSTQGPICVTSKLSLVIADGTNLGLYNGKTKLRETNLAAYMTVSADEAAKVAKVVEHKNKLYVIIQHCKYLKPVTTYLDSHKDQLDIRMWPVKLAHSLLILSLDLAPLDYRPVGYSSLNDQTTFVGYTDIQVNSKTNELVWVYVDPVPVTASVTQQLYKYQDTDPYNNDITTEFTTIEAYAEFRTQLYELNKQDPVVYNVNPFLARQITAVQDGTRSVTVGAHAAAVYVDEKLYWVSQTNVETLFDTQAKGGEQGGLLCIDDITGEIYLLRCTEAWGCLTGTEALPITAGFDHIDGVDGLPDLNVVAIYGAYIYQPYSGCLIGLSGYRVYNVTTGSLVKEFGGDQVMPRSHLSGELGWPQYRQVPLSPGAGKLALTGVADTTLSQQSFEGIQFAETQSSQDIISGLVPGHAYHVNLLPYSYRGYIVSINNSYDPSLQRMAVVGAVDASGTPIGPRELVFIATNYRFDVDNNYTTESTTGLYSLDIATGVITPAQVQPAVQYSYPGTISSNTDFEAMAAAGHATFLSRLYGTLLGTKDGYTYICKNLYILGLGYDSTKGIAATYAWYGVGLDTYASDMTALWSVANATPTNMGLYMINLI